MSLNLPRGVLDDADVREFHAPRLVDCRRRGCIARRGEHCLTPAGAFAPYHRERKADVAGMSDEQRRAGFVALGGELDTRRAERDAMMRQPLPPEVLATRAATGAAWAQIGRDVVAAERRGDR